MRALTGQLLLAIVLLFASSPLGAAPVHDWSASFGIHSIPHVASMATDGSGNILVIGDFEGTVNLGSGPLTSAGNRDILLAKFDANGNHLWSKRFGDSNYQVGYSVAADASGNVVITGRFRETTNFGGGPLTTDGDDDIFVAKYDADGNHLWSRRFGDHGAQQGNAIAVDGAGNIALTGHFTGTLDFGGGPMTNTGPIDVFVAKLDADGNHLWSRSFHEDGFQRGDAVAVDSSGGVVIAGDFTGTLNFGGGPLTSAGTDDIYLAKYDADGNHLWSKRFGDTQYQGTEGMTVDGLGNVVLVGWFLGSVDFGGGLFTSTDADDAFIATFDADGNPLWSRQFSGTRSQDAASVAVDAAQNILVSGFFQDTIDLGGGPLTSEGNYEQFVAKFDSDGHHQWSRRFPNVSAGLGAPIAMDGDGNAIFGGGFLKTVDLGGGPFAVGLTPDAFVAKFDASGNHLWSKRMGLLSGYGSGVGVAIDGAGDVVCTGYYQGAVDFGGGVLTSLGDDIFLAKFADDGNPLWSRSFTGSQAEYPYSIATDTSRNVLITGVFSGTVDFGGGPLTNVGYDIYVAKFDADGNHLWSKGFAGVGSNYPSSALATDGDGNVFVAGAFNGSMDFGGGALNSAGGRDAFVAKFDANGNHLWSKRFGDGAEQSVKSVDVDGSGELLLAGNFEGDVDFGGGPLTSAGGDIFVVQLDGDGNHLWSRRFGGAGSLSVESADTDGLGNVLVAGYFDGSVDFGGGALTSAGGTDICIASLDANGEHQWSRRFGGNANEFSTSVEADGSGHVLLTASSNFPLDFGGGPLPGDGFQDIFVASFDVDGNHRWSQRFVGDSENSPMSIAVGPAGKFALTGYLYGKVDFGGGTLGGNTGGAIFLAKFQDQTVPVRFARVAATLRNRAVEVQWDVQSVDVEERFTLFRRDDGHAQAVAIAQGPLRASDRSYLDANVEPGKTYHYQLVIQLRDGEALRSEVVSLTIPLFHPMLSQNSPNPFNPRTTIEYALSERTAAVLNIYDAAGRLVRRLDQGIREAGTYRAQWDGTDGDGHALASGMYCYQLEGVPGVAARKMLLVR
jgi:hypothetical protein